MSSSSIDEDKPVIVRIAGIVLDNLDRKAMGAGGGIDVDTAGFHGGTRLIPMAALFRRARPAYPARAGAKTKGLVVPGEEYLALQLDDDPRRTGVPFAVEEEGACIAVDDLLGLPRGRGMRRAAVALVVAVAAELAFHAHPWGGDNAGGWYDLRIIRPQR